MDFDLTSLAAGIDTLNRLNGLPRHGPRVKIRVRLVQRHFYVNERPP